MKILVIEVQTYENGSVSAPVNAYDNADSANAKYHQILASAAVSKLPVHSAVMMTDEGTFIKGEYFKHTAEVQE